MNFHHDMQEMLLFSIIFVPNINLISDNYFSGKKIVDVSH